MTELTPREIVSELDKFIIGQEPAKRAVAVALRSRWRRKKVNSPLKEEIYPKNILMIGPTGVGKTEISRRLSKLAGAPFVKVEATKFTEVGYVGRDVEQIVRDLVDSAMIMIREKMRKDVEVKAHAQAEKRVLACLTGENAREQTIEMFKKKLRDGLLDDKEIEIDLNETANPLSLFEIPGQPGNSMGMMNLNEVFGKALGKRTKKIKIRIADSYDLLTKEEADKLLDEDTITKKAIESVEENGIVFLDEIDKICARAEMKSADVSREGVQRDLLPLIEGTTVSTKYGPIRTDHILFIASGAFHIVKPSDLLPELQGRLPVRVELSALTEKDFINILKETENSLTKQYAALMLTEGIELIFEDSGIKSLAKIAADINATVENIGARRLYTILEKVFENLSFSAPDQKTKTVKIDTNFVKTNLDKFVSSTDVSRYVL
ncbi:MAG: HslU--HslV peptidase ATPase subunit [Rhodobacteraceae bacterium]|nr:MAG: HslU--HslV peptidase ATPase subunit [Paracoccaceae bacterium]|tara:strand:- start:230 stop:1537 length:1308 start_codon:yes stop_codon:yes gene_type:complete